MPKTLDQKDESELVKIALRYLENNQIHKAEALLSYCRKVGLLQDEKYTKEDQSED
jgi:hypothetical protein